MAKYESLPIIHIHPQSATLPFHHLPELVHLDDPATSVMIDFTHTPAHTISPNKTMNEALNEIKLSDLHVLLVVDDHGYVNGIIGSEDLLGEKPIKIIQERRILRQNMLVHMLMVPIANIIAFDSELIKEACVGHIVKTLTEQKQHYALVLDHHQTNHPSVICGMFTTAQIGKQLHTAIDTHMNTAESVSELQKRY